jgi:GT2 family glycosyltransferase
MKTIRQIHFLTIVYKSAHLLPAFIDAIDSLSLDTDVEAHIWVLYNDIDENCMHTHSLSHSNTSQVHIFSSRTNLGYAGGHNLLLKHVMNTVEGIHSIAILLNPDILVKDELVHAFLYAISALDAFLVSPSETSSIDNFTQDKYRASNRKKLLSISYLGPPSSIIVESRHEFIQSYLLTGACLALNLSLLKKYNIYLNPHLFMYLEEVDLVIQARKHKLSTYVISSITIEHNKGESIFNPRKIYYCTRNTLITLRGMPLELLPYFFVGRIVIPFFRLGLKYIIYWQPSCIAASIIGFWDGLIFRHGIKQIYHER